MRPRSRRQLPASLERELVLLERRLMDELRRELDRQLLAHKRYVERELDGVNGRIDGVLQRALRALNTKREEGRP